MTPNDTTTPNELRLIPINPPGRTIAIPVTVSPSHDDDRFHFRLRLTEEDARAREVLCELVAIRARGVACLVSFGTRSLGRCVVELLTAGERVFPNEHHFELVLHRKKLPAARPEKDRSDGQAEERALAPWAQELLGIASAPPWLEDAIHRILARRDDGLRCAHPDGSLGTVRVAASPEGAIRDAVAFGLGLYQEPCYALASTDPGQGVRGEGLMSSSRGYRVRTEIWSRSTSNASTRIR